MSRSRGFRRTGTRVWAMVGSDGNIGLAPGISLGVHTKGDRDYLIVLMGGGNGAFHEVPYDTRAAVHEKVCTPDPGTDATGCAQLAWEAIEAELLHRRETP